MKPARQDLEARAAVHAALSDVLRLRIVDFLALGDRSVGELRADLGVSSTLLSHHLRVLEVAGLVSQTRAESDRRRRYVQLHAAALLSDAPSVRVATRRVLFVCTGNTARSPIAAALWNRLSPVTAVSAGTVPGDAVSAQAVRVSARHGLDIATHVPVAVDQVVQAGDLLITVCDRAREVAGVRPDLHWSVPNPAASRSAAAYRTTYADLARRVASVAPHVAAA